MADPGEGPGGPDPPSPPAPTRPDPCLRQPCFQGCLLPIGRVGEDPGNEVLFQTETRTSTALYNTF